MVKFYLTWSNLEPKHPKEVYGISWETGLMWYGQINSPDKSLNQWKQEQIERYENLMKEYRDNGKVRKLNQIFHPLESDKNRIESDINFIDWCS